MLIIARIIVTTAFYLLIYSTQISHFLKETTFFKRANTFCILTFNTQTILFLKAGNTLHILVIFKIFKLISFRIIIDVPCRPAAPRVFFGQVLWHSCVFVYGKKKLPDIAQSMVILLVQIVF